MMPDWEELFLLLVVAVILAFSVIAIVEVAKEPPCKKYGQEHLYPMWAGKTMILIPERECLER